MDIYIFFYFHFHTFLNSVRRNWHFLNSMKLGVMYIYFGFLGEKYSFGVFFHDWNEWKNLQFIFSRSLGFFSIEHNFPNTKVPRCNILVSFPSHLKKLPSMLRFWLQKLNCGIFAFEKPPQNNFSSHFSVENNYSLIQIGFFSTNSHHQALR